MTLIFECTEQEFPTTGISALAHDAPSTGFGCSGQPCIRFDRVRCGVSKCWVGA
jgi:hypothetical protein